MSAIAQKLTLEEFERVYGDQKPYHEFWFGEAVPKAMPFSIHGLLQFLLMKMLDEVGFASVASEVRLNISADVNLLPDVIASYCALEQPYPTTPPEVAIEILSPGDTAQRLFRKCRVYADWGIPHIYVVDPEERTIQRWNTERHGLEDVEALSFEDKPSIAAERIWSELDLRLQKLTAE